MDSASAFIVPLPSPIAEHFESTDIQPIESRLCRLTKSEVVSYDATKLATIKPPLSLQKIGNSKQIKNT